MADEKLFGEQDDPKENLQDYIHQWANKVFPNRTIHHALLKMYGEISECIENPKDPAEWADVGILLFDLAAMNGVDIISAMQNKMEINIKRKWKIDNMGIMSHVKFDELDLNTQAYWAGVHDATEGNPISPEAYNYTGEFRLHYLKGYNDTFEEESSE